MTLCAKQTCRSVIARRINLSDSQHLLGLRLRHRRDPCRIQAELVTDAVVLNAVVPNAVVQAQGWLLGRTGPLSSRRIVTVALCRTSTILGSAKDQVSIDFGQQRVDSRLVKVRATTRMIAGRLIIRVVVDRIPVCRIHSAIPEIIPLQMVPMI